MQMGRGCGKFAVGCKSSGDGVREGGAQIDRALQQTATTLFGVWQRRTRCQVNRIKLCAGGRQNPVDRDEGGWRGLEEGKQVYPGGRKVVADGGSMRDRMSSA